MKECKKIFGEAELDESYFGARRKRGYRGKLKRGRGTLKQPVFGILKRNGRVYTEVIPNCKKVTLLPIIRGKVDPSTVIYSDGWRGYDSLVDVGYNKHFRVNHGENEFAKKGTGIHINGIENFWSFTKRRLSKFNGVRVNFELHLKECEWRYGRSATLLEKELKKIVKHYLNS
jgi:transposase-like protein